MKRPPEPLSQPDVEALLTSCSSRAATGIRNRAMIATMWRSGIRCGEALALRPADVDYDAGTLRVLHGKGDKARTVGIDRWALGEIRAWLTERKRWRVPASAPLFCTRTGRPIASSHVRRLLPRLSKRARVEKRVHAHGLRHSFAVEARKQGMDVGKISKQLGHSSLRTTIVYLDHVAPADVVDAVHSLRWVPIKLRTPRVKRKKRRGRS